MKSEKFKVTGVGKYQSNIMNLAHENNDYYLSNKELKELYCVGDKIWQYEFNPKSVELIQEENNPYDKNAVRVEVDGEVVGYIKKGSSAHVRNLLNSPYFHSVVVDSMGTGKFKAVYEDDNGRMHIDTGEFPGCWVHIKIRTNTTENKKTVSDNANYVPLPDSNPQKSEDVETKSQVATKKGKALFVVIRALCVILGLMAVVLCLVKPLAALLALAVAVWGWFKAKVYLPDETPENSTI